jgi:hypothetical protein
VKKVLLDFLEREEDQPAAYKVLDTLKIHITPASIRHRDVFLLGGYADLNSGGFLISEIYRNLKICIEDKTKKIERYKSKYRVWWLVLIDNVGHGLSKDDVIQLRAVGPLQHDWDRVLLVAPMNPEYGIQI